MIEDKPIDWTKLFIAHGGEVGKAVGARAWDNTTLGSIKGWPPMLTSTVNLCLTSAIPIVVWWGIDLIKIYNDSFQKLLHINHPATLGTAGDDLCEELWNVLGTSLQSVLEDGKPTRCQTKLTFKNNGIDEERYFTFFNSPIHDGLGKTGGVFTVVSENTATVLNAYHQKAEEKVQERIRALEERIEQLKLTEVRYLKMTEEVQDYAIILLDKDGTILNWNIGAEKIKGFREDEIKGKNFSIFYLEEDRKDKLPERLIQQAEQHGRAMHEGWRRRKDGSTFWGSIVITALHNDENNVIGFTKVTRDLTERKIADDMMRQHAAELETKNKQLEQFAYIASHDLQEPLRKIQTFVQVLERKFEEPELRQKYFTKINSSAKRMGDLIQSVLNYSRLSQNDELWVAVDLNEILENVKADYELLISEKEAAISSDKLPTVRGIALQLSQLFANLISNALKFSGVQPVIAISSNILSAGEIQKIDPSLDPSKNYLELIFADNGIGFESQYAEKIFTIFQRLNSREAYAGTGIGLALCKKIVENHQGHIKATSELGKGATFFVYLPLI